MSQPMRRSETGAGTGSGAGPARYDPFTELDRLTQQMSRLFDTQWPDLPSLVGQTGFTPLADVEETDDAYLIDMDLPDVRREDLDIEVTGRRLVVSGERKEKEREGLLRRRTRTVGRFRYEVTLPDEVDPDGIDASLQDGVLHLRIPKSQGRQRRRIEVK
jgi:HSP20 family protein